MTSHGVCELAHLGVIAAQGEEAALFLHNQLTQDFVLLDASHARWTAYCNAKGRMQASFVGFKTSEQEILLVLRSDLLAQTLKRLSMFVLRAKVKLSDASQTWKVFGEFTHTTDALSPWQLQHHAGVWHVGLYPASGVARQLMVAPPEWVHTGQSLSLDDWLLSEVLSGVAHVEAATFEAFVPQMLNYESVDGVNFKKGCYPGQEVVARSQFRGTLKRRTYLVHATGAMRAGQAVFAASDPSQPAGVVAQAASHATHGHWGLVCLQTALATSESLYPEGALEGKLTLHALPYALREDI